MQDRFCFKYENSGNSTWLDSRRLEFNCGLLGSFHDLSKRKDKGTMSSNLEPWSDDDGNTGLFVVNLDGSGNLPFSKIIYKKFVFLNGHLTCVDVKITIYQIKKLLWLWKTKEPLRNINILKSCF